MQIVCMSLFTEGVQNDHHLHGHMSGDALFTGASIISCRKSDHIAIKQCNPSVREGQWTNKKQNIGILHGVNLCTYFHNIWQTSVG